MFEARRGRLFDGKSGSQKTAIAYVRGTFRQIVSTGLGCDLGVLRLAVLDAFVKHLQNPVIHILVLVDTTGAERE